MSQTTISHVNLFKHAFLANTYNYITCIVSLTHLHNMLINQAFLINMTDSAAGAVFHCRRKRNW